MAKLRERIILSWSGGKDSVLALSDLRKSGHYDIVGLVTVVSDSDDRVTSHGVASELIEAQAVAIGIPLEIVRVPAGASNEVYIDRLHETLRHWAESGVRRVAFGDVYLDDLRDFREEHLSKIGMEGLFPLWNRCTKELAYSFINSRYKAHVTAVDTEALDPSFVGRAFDRSLLSDLPITVDPCGENGEFHTFVHDGPIFKRPVPVRAGARQKGSRFHFCDLAPRPRAAKSS